MYRPLKRRPSPAFVTACLALFVALGGVGYAATQINGAKLVNRSVDGKKLQLNTVTGREIAESKLAGVPSAHHADRATTAAHASSADSAISTHDLQGKGLSDLLGSAVRVRVTSGNIGAGDYELHSDCVGGEKAVGGGGSIDGPGALTGDSPSQLVGRDIFGGPIYSAPSDGSTANAWTLNVDSTAGPSGENFSVYAICVSAAG